MRQGHRQAAWEGRRARQGGSMPPKPLLYLSACMHIKHLFAELEKALVTCLFGSDDILCTSAFCAFSYDRLSLYPLIFSPLSSA